MPNHCHTTYAFKSTHVNKDNLISLHQKLAELLFKPSRIGFGFDFESGCLGEVAAIHDLDCEQVPCRGEITDIDINVADLNVNVTYYDVEDASLNKAPTSDDGHIYDYDSACYFKLETETAWCPMNELWDAVLEQYEGVSYVYVAEEAGCDIFINTDTEGQFFDQRYMLEICCNTASLIPKYWSFENVVCLLLIPNALLCVPLRVLMRVL